MKTTEQLTILSKRTMRHIMQMNQTISSKVPTFALISPILETVPKYFEKPLSFQIQILFQLIYSRLNNDYSPYLVIQTLSNAILHFSAKTDLDDQRNLVKFYLTNDINSLYKFLQTKNSPQSIQLLNSLQQNTPIQPPTDPILTPLYTLIIKKLDPEFSKKLSSDPPLQYLYQLLIQLKQNKPSILLDQNQSNSTSNFAKFFTQILRFLQNPQNLERIFDEIFPTFTSTEAKFALFIVFDAAVRTRQIANLTNYLRILLEISSLQAKNQLLDCLYLLDNVPQTMIQASGEQILNCKQYCFSLLLQQKSLENVYTEMTYFANSMFPTSEQFKLLNVKMAKLAEEKCNFFLAGHYSGLAGVVQSSDMLSNAIISKIQEIVGQQTVDTDIDGLEQFFSENDIPEAKDDLILAKDIHKLYKYLREGCDSGNNEILNLAGIVLQECQYEDIQQGIIRDLAHFNVISDNDSNQKNLMTSSLRQMSLNGNTIQEANKLLRSKQINKAPVAEYSADQFFVAAANMSVNWRLEVNDDDQILNWALIQKFGGVM